MLPQYACVFVTWDEYYFFLALFDMKQSYPWLWLANRNKAH